MKFLLPLAFLTAVCAIPRPWQISATSERTEQLAPTEGSGQGNDLIGDAEGTVHPELLLSELENSTESNNIENDDDDDDDDENVSFEDLIKALHRIRNAIQRKIHRNISHYKDSDDFIHVPFERVPVHKDNENETAADAPQQDNRTSEGPGNKGDHPQNDSVIPNNTKENETPSVHERKINSTQIKKEIHDKINSIIEIIFRPWLGNNSIENTVDNGNIPNALHPLAHISSRPEKDGTSPKPGSFPELEVPQSVEENEESESKVRFVNPIRSGWYYTRQSVQQPSLSYRNFPYQTAHHKGQGLP